MTTSLFSVIDLVVRGDGSLRIFEVYVDAERGGGTPDFETDDLVDALVNIHDRVERLRDELSAPKQVTL